MQTPSSSRAPNKKSWSNNQFSNPAPHHLRALVLDYLCHHCYTGTARAFARDSAIRHLDPDGDEIMATDSGMACTSAELDENVLRQVELREQIRTHILSGRVEAAVTLLNEKFPAVLSKSIEHTSQGPQKEALPDRLEYIALTSVDADHLSLNLRILAFIEACRTIPLDYTPPEPFTDLSMSGVTEKGFPSPAKAINTSGDSENSTTHQEDLLAKAQKLYALANMLPKPSDRAIYLKELSNVSGLLAYPTPESSPMAKYLTQERRWAVADQINSAILHRSGLPVVSHLELYTRYTSTLWSFMNELRMKPPTHRPTGVQLPPTRPSRITSGKDNTSDKEAPEVVPPFDLQEFIDFKT